LVAIKYASNSSLVTRKMPIVEHPGKPVRFAIQTGFYVTNKEIMNADEQSRVEIKRVTHKNKSLKLVVPTIASEHWVTLTGNWQCVLESFKDPKSGDEQLFWRLDYLHVKSYPIECAKLYDLSGTVRMVGSVKSNSGTKGTYPSASFEIDFESIGPTGAKTKTKQKLAFDFVRGAMKKG